MCDAWRVGEGTTEEESVEFVSARTTCRLRCCCCCDAAVGIPSDHGRAVSIILPGGDGARKAAADCSAAPNASCADVGSVATMPELIRRPCFFLEGLLATYVIPIALGDGCGEGDTVRSLGLGSWYVR